MLKKTVVTTALLLISSAVNAGLLSADFSTVHSFKYIDPSITVVHQASVDPLSPGSVPLALTSAFPGFSYDEVSINFVVVDPSSSIFTLTPQSYNFDFQTFDLWITNIVLPANESIVGFDLISPDFLVLGAPANLQINDPSVAGPNLHLSYDSGGAPLLFTPGSFAEFVILTEVSTPVTPEPQPPGQQIPEPASLALFGLGLLGAAAARRRKAL